MSVSVLAFDRNGEELDVVHSSVEFKYDGYQIGSIVIRADLNTKEDYEQLVTFLKVHEAGFMDLHK